MWVHFVDADLFFYFAPHDLKTHHGSLVVIDVFVQKLELNCILNVKVRENYGQGVALRELLAYSFHRGTYLDSLVWHKNRLVSQLELSLLLCFDHFGHALL